MTCFLLQDDDEHIGEIFQDETNEAAILLHRDPDGSYLLVSTIARIAAYGASKGRWGES